MSSTHDMPRTHHMPFIHHMPFTHRTSCTDRMSFTHYMPYTHYMPFTHHMPFTDHMSSTHHVPNRRWPKPKLVTVAEASVELWLISLGPPPGPRSDVKGRNRSHARPDSVSQISGTRNLERRNCCVSRGFGVPGFGTPLGWPGRRVFQTGPE